MAKKLNIKGYSLNELVARHTRLNCGKKAMFKSLRSSSKLSAAGKELASLGASVAGGVAGGALAGLVCDPGAPVCVTVGARVGGTLAAFGAASSGHSP